MNKIDCFKCKYLFITWDKQKPRGCKFFGFKSPFIPSIVVKKSSGKDCYAFTPKKSAK